MQTIVTGHAAGPPDPQLELHADTFHPSLKAWLFLTDVTDDQGPLTYVAGSHRLTPQRLAWEQARSIDIEPATLCPARLAPDHARRTSALGLPQPTPLRGPRQHPRRDRHLRFPSRGTRTGRPCARRFGFRPPHAVRPMDGLRPALVEADRGSARCVAQQDQRPARPRRRQETALAAAGQRRPIDP